MCVLHVKSQISSFTDFLSQTTLPVYRSHNAGEKSPVREGVVYSEYAFSCDVSKKAWSNVEGQVEDMLLFLKTYQTELQTLMREHYIEDIRMDMPYVCRLNEQFFSQCDYFPPELLLMLGELGIGMEFSLYWPTEDE